MIRQLIDTKNNYFISERQIISSSKNFQIIFSKKKEDEILNKILVRKLFEIFARTK